MNTKYWKCATSDRCTDVYITTSDAGDLAGHSATEITEAHLHEAREAFFCYSLPRGIVLTDLREVSVVPRVKTEVASWYAWGPEPKSFSISTIVYEVSVDVEIEEDRQVSASPGGNSCEDGLDSKRRDVLEDAKSQLLEVIYCLEGLLDEENEQYDELPASLRESEDGGDAGKERQIIQSAIRLLYDGHHALEHELPDANPLPKAI